MEEILCFGNEVVVWEILVRFFANTMIFEREMKLDPLMGVLVKTGRILKFDKIFRFSSKVKEPFIRSTKRTPIFTKKPPKHLIAVPKRRSPSHFSKINQLKFCYHKDQKTNKKSTPNKEWTSKKEI
jgi:hypothetical protein